MKKQKLAIAMTIMEDNTIINKPKRRNIFGRSRSNRPDRYGDCDSCCCTDCSKCRFVR